MVWNMKGMIEMGVSYNQKKMETEFCKLASFNSNRELSFEGFDREKNTLQLSEIGIKKVSKLSKIIGGEKMSGDIFEIELSDSCVADFGREKKDPQIEYPQILVVGIKD